MATIESFNRMIFSLAHKWKNEPRVGFEDLVSEGTWAAYKAIEDYKPDKRTKLSTFVYFYIRNAMYAYYNANRYTLKSSFVAKKNDLQNIVNQEKMIVSLNQRGLRTGNGDNESSLESIIPAKSENSLDKIILEEQIAKLKQELQELPEREKFIVNNYHDFFGNKCLEQVGDSLGITRQAVHEISKKIKNKLRTRLEGVCT
jgi:RNA polymerase sigma-32 factor